MTPQNTALIKLALPKGRMEKGVYSLLESAGIELRAGSRTYRPVVSLPEFEAKLLKPRDIVEMLQLGSRDIGFSGADWVAEQGAELVELLDTGLDPVRLVAAAPAGFLQEGELPKHSFVVASEYRGLTMDWVRRRNVRASFVLSNGATEVFPPEDADCIVDNTATGSTLRANGLEIIDELLVSSTRLYANPKSLEDTAKRGVIENFVLLLRSVLEARKRVMLEMNVSAERFDELVKILPCMREPTIAPLYGDSGFAVKAAVPRGELPRLIPLIRKHGGTDILVTQPSQIVP